MSKKYIIYLILIKRYNVESTFPGVVMELTEQEIKDYFTPRDFKVSDQSWAAIWIK